MESDLKRVARLEYLKLRQSKQSEKVDAVKVLYRIHIELKTYKHWMIVYNFREYYNSAFPGPLKLIML